MFKAKGSPRGNLFSLIIRIFANLKNLIKINDAYTVAAVYPQHFHFSCTT